MSGLDTKRLDTLLVASAIWSVGKPPAQSHNPTC